MPNVTIGQRSHAWSMRKCRLSPVCLWASSPTIKVLFNISVETESRLTGGRIRGDHCEKGLIARMCSTAWLRLALPSVYILKGQDWFETGPSGLLATIG